MKEKTQYNYESLCTMSETLFFKTIMSNETIFFALFSPEMEAMSGLHISESPSHLVL